MVDRLVAPGFPLTIDALDQLDHKTQLQERAARAGTWHPDVQGRRDRDPITPRRSSPRCSSTDVLLGQGTGHSKKSAEQLAASAACATFD